MPPPKRKNAAITTAKPAPKNKFVMVQLPQPKTRTTNKTKKNPTPQTNTATKRGTSRKKTKTQTPTVTLRSTATKRSAAYDRYLARAPEANREEGPPLQEYARTTTTPRTNPSLTPQQTEATLLGSNYLDALRPIEQQRNSTFAPIPTPEAKPAAASNRGEQFYLDSLRAIEQQRVAYLERTAIEAQEIKDKVEQMGIVDLQIARDVQETSNANKLIRDKLPTYKTERDREDARSRDELTLVELYQRNNNAQKALELVSTDHFQKFLAKAHLQNNPQRLNIRINPDTGEIEMFIGENFDIFGKRGKNPLTQRFVSNKAQQIEEGTGTGAIFGPAREFAFDGTITDGQSGEKIQVWEGYSPASTDKDSYAEYLDNLCEELEVDRIYAHQGGVAIAQLMNYPAERIGIDGDFDLNKDERVAENRGFINFVTSKTKTVNTLLSLPIIQMAQFDLGDDDMQYDLGRKNAWSEALPKPKKKTKKEYEDEARQWERMTEQEQQDYREYWEQNYLN